MPVNIKKTVKFSLITLTAVVVLLLSAPLFIDVEDFKPAIIEQAEKATGRSVEIGGLSASLFPWVGIQLEDVRISNPEGFSEQAFFSVDSLDVEMALFPLFNKQVEIRRFALDAPQLLLERNAQGEGNWQQPEGDGDPSLGLPEPEVSTTSSPATEKAPAHSILAAFSAEAISVSQGKIIWLDTKTQAQTQISNLQLDMESVRLDSPIPIHLSGEVEDSAFVLDGQFGPVSDLAAFNLEKLPVQAHLKADRLAFKVLARYVPALAQYADLRLAADVQFEQRPDGLRLSVGSARLTAMHDLAVNWKLEMPTAEEALLRSLTLSVDGKEVVQARGEISGIGKRIRYEMRVNTPEVERQTLASWLPQLDSMYAAHPAPWRHVKLGLLASGGTDHLDLRDLQLLLDGELVQASGMLQFGERPDLKLRLAANTLHINPWLPKPDPDAEAPMVASEPSSLEVAMSDVRQPQSGALIAPAGSPQGSVIQPSQKTEQERAATSVVSREIMQGSTSGTPEPDLRFLAPLRLSAQVQIERFFMHGLEMDHLRADISGKNGKFKLNPLRFELAGGQIEESATINVSTYPARWTESSTISGMQVQPVLTALTGKDIVLGVADMELNLSGRGLLAESATNTMSGQGHVLLRDGQVKGFDIPGMLRSLSTLGRDSGSRATDFTQLEGNFTIKNGIVNNDDLYMASPMFRLTGYGFVDLPKQSMDYHVRPRLVGSLAGQGDTAEVRKGLTIPLRLVGPIASPKPILEVKLEDLLNKENIQGVLRQLEDEVKGGGARRWRCQESA